MNIKRLAQSQVVRLSGGARGDYYTVAESGVFAPCDKVRLFPADDYLKYARREQLDTEGALSALACFVEAR